MTFVPIKKNWEGGKNREDWSFRDINECIEENQLVDVAFEGSSWTWSNN